MLAVLCGVSLENIDLLHLDHSKIATGPALSSKRPLVLQDRNPAKQSCTPEQNTAE